MHTDHDRHGADPSGPVLTIRPHSGLSGDMLVCGLAVLNLAQLDLRPDSLEASRFMEEQAARIMPELAASVTLEPTWINGIGGWRAKVTLPDAHEHRNLEAVLAILEKSQLDPAARKSAAACFELVALSESRVHGKPVEEIHFHEVGALDSVLDICLACSLYHQLEPAQFVCAPLPMADGTIQCAHGLLPAPAPAVLQMLKDVPVRPFAGAPDAGELVTPTAIALLRALHTTYGAWPEFTPAHIAIAYGSRVFSNAPNGAVFAFGPASP